MQVSPEKMKAQLLAKMKTWEAEVLGRKCDVLQPVVIGVTWWSPDTEPDPPNNKLQDFQVILVIEMLQLLIGIVMACTVLKAAVKANIQRNGKGQISTSWQRTHKRISMKLGTTSWV